jgi:hypothetical protein
MGDTRFGEAYRQGAALSRQQAVELALRQPVAAESVV